jgi:broad specificity polyphosphatase/5'/3'-nucleotidase SurE
LNLNVPSCPVGSLRGVRLVPLGQTSRVSGYNVQSGTIDNGTFAPTVATQNAVATANCLSTLLRPADDIEAFNNGFVSATVLNPDLTDRTASQGRVDWRWYGIERRLLVH